MQMNQYKEPRRTNIWFIHSSKFVFKSEKKEHLSKLLVILKREFNLSDEAMGFKVLKHIPWSAIAKKHFTRTCSQSLRRAFFRDVKRKEYFNSALKMAIEMEKSAERERKNRTAKRKAFKRANDLGMKTTPDCVAVVKAVDYDPDQKCLVCKEATPNCQYPCGHDRFCFPCVQREFGRRNKRCPICKRGFLNINQVKRN